MNTQNYVVNIRVGLANPARVNISQDDTGRTLAFGLYDGLSPFTPPTGSTVTIVGRKPSKLGFSETCTVSGNVATVATTLAMTQEAGKFPAELRIEAGGQSIGTANFTMYVEPSPHPDGTTDGTHATVDNLQTQIGDLANLTTTAKTNLVSAINEAAQSGGVVIDDTLTQTGQAADAKKTGDEISAIKADLSNLDDRVDALEGEGGGLSTDVKTALLQLAQKVAYIDDGGQDYYDDLYNALYPPAPPASLTSITAVYTQSGTVYSDDSLDSLKSDLVVTALYDNGTSQVLSDSDYTLTGNFNAATSIVTATFSGKTATFNVSVTLVGSTEYADALSNWFLTTVPTATYSDGKITIKGSQSNANAFKLLCFDRAKTLWDTVNGKKLKIRVTMDSPDWVGEISTTAPQNRVIVGVAIYKNSTITSGNDRLKTENLNTQILPSSTPTTYEFIFDADVSNFSTGSGTPTSVSTFGVYIYNASANTLEITDCSVVEVLTS